MFNVFMMGSANTNDGAHCLNIGDGIGDVPVRDGDDN